VFLTKGYSQLSLQSAQEPGTEKVLKVRYPAFTIRNLNPYESKVFYKVFPGNRFLQRDLERIRFLENEIPYRWSTFLRELGGPMHRSLLDLIPKRALKTIH
jgi:hypothetical protein